MGKIEIEVIQKFLDSDIRADSDHPEPKYREYLKQTLETLKKPYMMDEEKLKNI